MSVDIQIVEDFLFWCMLINLALYFTTVIAVFAFKGLLVAIHQKLFGFDEAMTLKTVQNYIANYKLLITVFNFVPWLAILIIK